MSEVGNLKWIEAGLLLAAGVGFGWWQLRDIKRAQRDTRAKREAQQALPAQDTQEKKDKAP
jgi:predicted negative regulator of RcsB-dependent stress response